MPDIKEALFTDGSLKEAPSRRVAESEHFEHGLGLSSRVKIEHRELVKDGESRRSTISGVAQITFLYLAMLRREGPGQNGGGKAVLGPQEWIYEELRRAQDRRTYRLLKTLTAVVSFARAKFAGEETDPMEYVQKLVVVGLQGCLADVRERKTSAGKTIRGSDELPEWCQMLPDLKREPEHILKAEWMLNSWEPGKITEPQGCRFLELLRMERAFVILVAAFGKDEAPRAWAPFGRQGQGFSVVDHGGSGGFGVWGGEDEDDPWAEEGEDSSGPNGLLQKKITVHGDIRSPGGSQEAHLIVAEEPAAHDPPVEPGGAGDSAPIPAPAESERAAAGPPSREPHFGTEFWKASDAEDRNPFFATDFELRTAPQNSSFSCLEEWLSAGGQGEYKRFRLATPSCSAFHVRALEPGGGPSARAAGEAAAGLSRTLGVAPAGHGSWDSFRTVLCTPRSELWLKFSVAEGLAEAKEQALLAWLVRVLSDVLNETVYLAEQASLELRVQEEPYGLDLRAGGFHQKLPQLLTEGCKALRSAGDPHSREWWQGESFVRRCWNQRDDLLRHWRNEYLKPEDHCADLRRALVMPEKLLSTAKAAALQDLGLEELQRFAEAFIPQLQLEVLYQGNVTREEALTLVDELSDLMGTGPTDEGPHALHPPTRVLEVPLEGSPIVWFQDSPDAKDRNVAMEMYWQLGRSDGAEARETAKVELLQDVLAEPFFDQLRTKQQVGYVASCGARWTHRVQGFSVWLVSSKFGPVEICQKVESFLESFQQTLQEMSEEEFQGHVEAMAAAKLEPERSLKSLQQSAWAELQERSHCFDRAWLEALALFDLKKSELVDLLRDLTSPRRRLLITAAIGGKAVERSAALAQEAFAQRYPAARWVSSPSELFASSKFFT
ncbi:Nardilysin-like (N-arginine dibasic convertase-like) (NRD convertase-like) (NRD-C) [Durusdinium trenchii]|uniref:Nardilysin-like (N-arginine dibasic convertase-like) (NRD convertase-like) (NRD-C) n=1 Tax=Durusdinium trenchii TaxID=1381693 RepID=A0ABP0N4N8_9DINO